MRLRAIIIPLTAGVLAACAFRGPAEPTLTQKEIAEVVASPDRSAADRQNDQRRKPEEMLAFIGITPGIVALDVSAAGGYTTELLARAIGPNGAVYGQSAPPRENAARPAQPEGNASGMMTSATASATPVAAAAAPPVRRSSPESLKARADAMREAGVPAAAIVPVVQPFDNPVPAQATPSRLDLVTFMFNYHDMGFMGVDRDKMNRAIFTALKSGGQYVIADHAGRPGTGISESGTLHRIEEAFLVREVEAAGFKLAATGDFLRNPNDPRDKNTPNPPQPKDEFVVKFVKP
jgi:predicted methyltransferase